MNEIIKGGNLRACSREDEGGEKMLYDFSASLMQNGDLPLI